MKAKRFAEKFLADELYIELKNVSRGKYFRITVDVYMGDKSKKDGVDNVEFFDIGYFLQSRSMEYLTLVSSI